MKKIIIVLLAVAIASVAAVIAYVAGKDSVLNDDCHGRMRPKPVSKRTLEHAKRSSVRRVVLVVQNHTSDTATLPLAAFADSLAVGLSNDKIRIINPHNVIGIAQNKTATGEAMLETSALGLAQMLGADGVLTASILEFTADDIGVPPIAYVIKVRLALSLADAATGEAVCGTGKAVFSKNCTADEIKAGTASLYESLMHEATAKCSAEFLRKFETTAWDPVGVYMANVDFTCNIEGADVKIDGVSMGTTPVQICVAEGVHNIKVEYPFCIPFSTKALLEDGQSYDTTLKLDAAGRECFKDEALFKEKIEDIRRKRDADEYVSRILAEAKAAYIKYLTSGENNAGSRKDISSVIDENIKKMLE